MTSKWDGLADDLSGPSRHVCGVHKFFQSEDWEDVDTFNFIRKLTDGSEHSAAVVAKALAKRSEHAPSAWTIRAHRRGECACRK